MTEELNHVFFITRQYLSAYGVWPDPHSPLNDRRLNIKFVLLMSGIFIFITMPQLTNMIRAWGNVTKMMGVFASTSYSMLAMFKLFVTWYHGKKLRLLLESIIADWTISTSDWERNIMLKSAKVSRTFSLRCWLAMGGMSIFSLSFHYSSFFHHLKEPRRFLVYRVDYIQRSPIYEIIFSTQVFFGANAAMTNTAVDSFVSILVLHICSQLIKLRRELNNLVNALANKSISSLEFQKGLVALIVRHENLIRKAKIIDDCYSSVLFVNVLLVTFQMCSLTFQIFTIISANLAVPIIRMIFLLCYISVMLVQLFTYCYAAESLMTESTNLVYGVYECHWYDISAKDAKNLMIIVHRSMIPLRLTAGKFGIFSLEMFGITLKTAMGYLSVLLTLKENDN